MLKILDLFVEDIDDPPFFCSDQSIERCCKKCVGLFECHGNELVMSVCPNLALKFEDRQVFKIIEDHLTGKSKRIDTLEQEIEDLKAQLEEIQHV